MAWRSRCGGRGPEAVAEKAHFQSKVGWLMELSWARLKTLKTLHSISNPGTRFILLTTNGNFRERISYTLASVRTGSLRNFCESERHINKEKIQNLFDHKFRQKRKQQK